MGKFKRIKVTQKLTQPTLGEQIQAEKEAKPSSRIKSRVRKDDETEFVEPGVSRAILRAAQEQQSAIARESGGTRLVFPKFAGFAAADEDDDEDDEGEDGGEDGVAGAAGKGGGPRQRRQNRAGGAEEDGEDSDGDDDAASETSSLPDLDNIRISEEDEKAFASFMSSQTPARRKIADLIMEKLEEKKDEIASELSDGRALVEKDLDPRVVEMFKGVREVLSKYRRGKLPKAFKIVPKLSNWEQILYLTEPDRWTASAMYEATRIFASGLNERMAQRFYNLILLPRVRDDIAEYKKLNFHLYQALRKALFKPGAFYKGILLPLCEAGDCTLREAIIIGSVIAKNSIPVVHSAAAMAKIAEMDYSGASSIFLRILFDKKYALPYRVIDAVVAHFLRFRLDDRTLPVLWHQALLTFVQRYKEDVSSEQKEAIMDLVKAHCHHQIGPEIRRELLHSRCRDLESFEYAEADGGGDGELMDT